MFLFFRLIEQIGSQDVSNVIWKVFLLCVEDGFNQESEVRDRCEIARKTEFSYIVCLCAGTHREYKITDMDIFRNCSGRAYTDQRLNTVSFDQFMRINSDRRTAHSCSHDRNRFVAVKSGVAEHISCSIELFRTGKEIFSYKFCAERITRK